MRPTTPLPRLVFQVFAALALIAGGLLFIGATRTDSRPGCADRGPQR
jgi:hypothetical protein